MGLFRELIDKNSNTSSIRYGFIICIWGGVGCAVLGLVAKIVLDIMHIPTSYGLGSLSGLVGTLLGIGFGGKGYQQGKETEEKIDKNDNVKCEIPVEKEG